MKHLFEEQIQRIESEFAQLDERNGNSDQPTKVFATTSCQSNSVVLLHYIDFVHRPRFSLIRAISFRKPFGFVMSYQRFWVNNNTTFSRCSFASSELFGRQLYTSDRFLLLSTRFFHWNPF